MDTRTKEAIRYLGYGKHAVDENTLQSIEDSFHELTRIAERKYISQIYDLYIKDDNLLVVENVEISSRSLYTNLKDCKQVVLFAATLGTEVDRLVRKTQIVDMAKAVVVQACATTLLEEYCDELQCEVAEQLQQGKYLRPRFSPGYGDFCISHQRDFISLLNTPKAIGLSMTDSYMLTPTKSVTAVMGISDIATKCGFNTCENCDKTDCKYKRG